MKKLIYCAAALATALFAGSCQRELLDPAQDGSTVTFSVEIPEVAGTKANVNGIGNGADINNLVYAVYKTDKDENEAFGNLKSTDLVYCINPLDPKGDAQGVNTYFNQDGKAHVTLELVKNQKYVVLFWAQNEETWVSGEEFDLTQITYPDTDTDKLKANLNKYEAFCGAAFVGEVTGATKKSVTLTRPFAQINLATNNPKDYEVNIATSSVKVWGAADKFNVATMTAIGTTDVEYVAAEKPAEGEFKGYEHYVAMNYIFANEKGNNTQTVKVECTINSDFYANGIVTEIENVPVAQNYKTNILGDLLTSKVDYTVELDKNWKGEYERPADGDSYTTNEYVATADEFNDAFTAAFEGDKDNNVITLSGDINLNELTATRSNEVADPPYTIAAGKTLTIDLNGKKLSATSAQSGKNYEMFLVKGNLNVKNGTIEYEHKGENMGWGSMTCIFDVTAGGILNLERVTAKNLGGSDMGFVAHLNNWGEVTLNVENSTLESNYVAVRVFNSGYDMNNVTIKNSTLKGVSAAFWVHNYTVDDFGTVEKVESQKALLNLNIYNQGNTFSPDVNGIRYGFTNSIRTDAYGITKTVSEDGTEVTLGSLIENGLIRRGVAGTEENTTIKKVIVEEGVAVLYDRTFRRFYALEEVVLPSTLTTIGAAGSGVFQSCNNLKKIVIPESVTVLGKGSFQECSSLESINIPAGVTRIESDALRATGLKSVEFHAGVTYFGAQAFRDCKQLTEVVINAPEFTMEKNTFGIMAAPFTPMTIHVANAEMKAYVESNLTAHDKTYITVKAAEVTTTEELNIALTNGAKIVSVSAGEYTFPAGSVKAGTTIVCEEGTVFTGKSSLNINGATVIGATFENKDGEAVSGTIYGTFKNCTFEGSETLRWCYTTAGQTSLFENCVVKTTLRGVHFDEMNGDVTFKNCEINGFNAYSGAGTMTFEGCTFGHDESKYNGLNIYTNTIVKDCQFNFVSGNTNFIDMEGTGKTLTIENCTATLDGAAAPVIDFVGGSQIAVNTVIIDGKACVSYNAVNPEGDRYEGDIFQEGYKENALWFNNKVFGGNAAIVIENKYSAHIIENCSGNFRNDVITYNRTEDNAIVWLENLNFTLEEGKKLINSKNTKMHQVFMVNITINGEKMTQETVAKYLENVEWYQVVPEEIWENN